jgi:hypothetical protein
VTDIGERLVDLLVEHVDALDLAGHAGRQHQYVVTWLEHTAGDPAGVAAVLGCFLH